MKKTCSDAAQALIDSLTKDELDIVLYDRAKDIQDGMPALYQKLVFLTDGLYTSFDDSNESLIDEIIKKLC